ncbi:MAG: hypothetical protein FJ290_19340 [Planctomycetes bacterium]|nr:hypothetical protein [Planctomycetota bacterium]
MATLSAALFLVGIVGCGWPIRRRPGPLLEEEFVKSLRRGMTIEELRAVSSGIPYNRVINGSLTHVTFVQFTYYFGDSRHPRTVSVRIGPRNGGAFFLPPEDGVVCQAFRSGEHPDFMPVLDEDGRPDKVRHHESYELLEVRPRFIGGTEEFKQYVTQWLSAFRSTRGVRP